jgi:DNA-binding FadR family transcriptional regulator
MSVLGREKTLPEQIERILVRRIVRGELIGEGPSEAEIAVEFKVSKAVVREVCARLVTRGLADVRSGRRMEIAPRARWDLFDALIFEVEDAQQQDEMLRELLTVRRILEPEVAREAALHAERRQLADLQGILAEMWRCQHEMRGFLELDLAFHSLIAAASNNELLAHIVRSLRDLQAVSLERTNQVPGGIRAATNGHAKILDALLARDGEAAATEMARHLDLVAAGLDPAQVHAARGT